jgi:uncharacterized protein YxjI
VSGTATPQTQDTHDPFASLSQLVFRQSFEQPFRLGYQILDNRRRLVGRLFRSGQGLGIAPMNYTLEDATHHPIYLIRQPGPPPTLQFQWTFSLDRPDGTPVGKLSWRTGFGNVSYFLSIEGAEPLSMVKPAWIWTGNQIRRGTRAVASLRAEWFPFPSSYRLEFPPSSTDSIPHSLVVALVAWMCIWSRWPFFPAWPV